VVNVRTAGVLGGGQFGGCLQIQLCTSLGLLLLFLWC
jgi:hypothetical protein